MIAQSQHNNVLKFCLTILVWACIITVLVLHFDATIAQASAKLTSTYPAVLTAGTIISLFGVSTYYLVPSGIGACLCLAAATKQSPIKNKLRNLGTQFFYLFVTVSVSGLTNMLIKYIVGRSRPRLLIDQNIEGFHPFTWKPIWHSFPSGHATTVFAVAYVLSYFYPKAKTSLWIAAVTITLSRVIVNAHYPSDIIAGGLWGYFTSYLIMQTTQKTQFAKYGLFPINKAK